MYLYTYRLQIKQLQRYNKSIIVIILS